MSSTYSCFCSNKNLEMEIKVAGIIPECVVNGPGGISYTIFAQGCKHKCKGCHNPETHSFSEGKIYKIKEIIDDIKEYPLSDIATFTGGDPFFQPLPFSVLAGRLKEDGYKVVGYTGFYFEDIFAHKERMELLKNLDILIDGPYQEEKKDRSLNFRGSSNQRILEVDKSLKEGKAVEAETYYEGRVFSEPG